MTRADVLVLGGGAAGLMCAITAARRGRSVIVLEGSNRVGKKILMSGGGRCNFTNLHCEPSRYLSHNPHFCKSALSRYTQHDFIALVEKHGIPYHEKTLGQLFCDNSSKDIVAMLLSECDEAGVVIETSVDIGKVCRDDGFRVSTNLGDYACDALVVPSRRGDGLPTVLAEARAHGLPMVATRVGAIPSYLGADPNARLVRPDSPAALRRAIGQLMG